MSDLRKKINERDRLFDIACKLQGNVKLQQKFIEVLTDETKLKEMKDKVEELRAMLTVPAELEESSEMPNHPAGD